MKTSLFLSAVCGLLLFSLVARGEEQQDAPKPAQPAKVVPAILGEPQIYKIVVEHDLKFSVVKPGGQDQADLRMIHRALRVYVVKPAGWQATDTRPAMVFFHGGGWVMGGPGQFNAQAKHFAARGMVCVLVEYRLLKPGKEAPLVCVQDAKSAMRWVRAHAAELGVDAQRIAAGGGSAGGHLAAFVGMVKGLDDPGDDLAVSPRADALVLFNPVFDNGPGQWGYERVGERFGEFSPAHNISPDDPPAIVMLGTQDKLIPVAVVDGFKAAMEKVGVRCDVRLYEGAGHGFFNGKPFDRQTLLAADEFLVSLGWLPAPIAATGDQQIQQ